MRKSIAVLLVVLFSLVAYPGVSSTLIAQPNSGVESIELNRGLNKKVRFKKGRLKRIKKLERIQKNKLKKLKKLKKLN